MILVRKKVLRKHFEQFHQRLRQVEVTMQHKPWIAAAVPKGLSLSGVWAHERSLGKAASRKTLALMFFYSRTMLKAAVFPTTREFAEHCNTIAHK